MRTLAYAAVFNAGVRPSELERWMITSTPFSVKELHKMLRMLKHPNIVWRSSTSSPVSPREIARLRQTAAWVPWIQSIWLTGSFAAGRGQVGDDIDCMILVDPHRLWLARGAFVLFGLVQGKVRTLFLPPNHSWAGHWCLNLWLEPSAWQIVPQARTLYTAREIVQACPVYVRRDARPEVFIERNAWARSFVASGWLLGWKRALRSRRWPQQGNQFAFFSPFVSLLNRAAYRVQHFRIQQHVTRETIAIDRAFFHPRDTRNQVQAKYERICAALGVSPWPNEHKPLNDIPSRPIGRSRKSKTGLQSGSPSEQLKMSSEK